MTKAYAYAVREQLPQAPAEFEKQVQGDASYLECALGNVHTGETRTGIFHLALQGFMRWDVLTEQTVETPDFSSARWAVERCLDFAYGELSEEDAYTVMAERYGDTYRNMDDRDRGAMLANVLMSAYNHPEEHTAKAIFTQLETHESVQRAKEQERDAQRMLGGE